MRLTPYLAYLLHKLGSALEIPVICSFHLQSLYRARQGVDCICSEQM